MRHRALEGQAGIGGLQGEVQRNRLGCRRRHAWMVEHIRCWHADRRGERERGVGEARLDRDLDRLVRLRRVDIDRGDAQAVHIAVEVGGAEMQSRGLDTRHPAAALGDLCGQVDVVQRRQPGARQLAARKLAARQPASPQQGRDGGQVGDRGVQCHGVAAALQRPGQGAIDRDGRSGCLQDELGRPGSVGVRLLQAGQRTDLAVQFGGDPVIGGVRGQGQIGVGRGGCRRERGQRQGLALAGAVVAPAQRAALDLDVVEADPGAGCAAGGFTAAVRWASAG